MNTLPVELRGLVQGAEKVEELFGGWPRFHDAEVMRLELNREGPTLVMALRVFGPNRGPVAEVLFTAERIHEVELGGFNHQNVLADLVLDVTERDGAVSLHAALEGIFGLTGSFECDRLVVTSARL